MTSVRRHKFKFKFQIEIKTNFSIFIQLSRNKLLTPKGLDLSICKPYDLKQNICKAFTAGYFFQLAKRRSTYIYAKLNSSGEHKDVYLHPSGSLFRQKPLPDFIIFHEVMETTKAYMIGAMVTKTEWIKEYSPDFFKKIENNYIL